MAMTRSELYKCFGPKLMEALTLVVKDEINLIRISLVLSERSNEQIRTALENKLGLMTDYDWMSEDI